MDNDRARRWEIGLARRVVQALIHFRFRFPSVVAIRRTLDARGEVRKQAAFLNDVADASPQFHDCLSNRRAHR